MASSTTVKLLSVAMNLEPLEPLALLSCPSKDHATVTYKLPPNMSRADQDFILSLRPNDMLVLGHDARLNVSTINGRRVASQPFAKSVDMPLVSCDSNTCVGTDASTSSSDSGECSSSESSAAAEPGPSFTMLLVAADGTKISESIDLDSIGSRQFAEDCFKRLYEKKLADVRSSLHSVI